MELETFQSPYGLDYTALLLWALSGAIVARRKGLDIVGVFVIALVSCTGGGILRDGLFLQQRPPVIVRTDYLVIILIATVTVTLFGTLIERLIWWERLVAIIDAIATPMYAFLGTALALSVGVPPAGALLIGAVNGVGGGVLRDVLVGDVPQALRPGQFYVMAVVIACIVYEVLVLGAGWSQRDAGWLVIGLFIIVRLLAIRYNWRSLAVNEWQLTPLELGDLGPQQLTRRLGRGVRPEGQVDDHELR